MYPGVYVEVRGQLVEVGLADVGLGLPTKSFLQLLKLNFGLLSFTVKFFALRMLRPLILFLT